MNNTWKYIGGAGAALGALAQLYFIYQFREVNGEYMAPEDLQRGVANMSVWVIVNGCIAAGFFLAPKLR